MKTQLSFLKGISIICLSSFLMFFNCSKDVDVQTEEMQPLNDVLTLELSFGDEKTIVKDEYLIALTVPSTPNPTTHGGIIAVNDTNDIFVVDENRIKVYDSKGRPKTIIGHPGQGPGEFEAGRTPTITPEGFLSVMNGHSVNFFGPDLKFIESKNFDIYSPIRNFRYEKGMQISFQPRKVYRFNEKQNILYFDTIKEEKESKETYKGDGLIYFDPDTLFEIVSCYPKKDEKGLKTIPPVREGFVIIGAKYENPNSETMFDILPGNRIIYSNSVYDCVMGKNESYYTLHIFDIDTFKYSQIVRPYVPVKISESLKSGLYTEKGKKSIENFMERKKIEYFYPLHKIMTDRNYAFLFIYHTYYYAEIKEGVKREFLVEVLDVDTGELVSKVYLPFRPHVIKNGYAYYLNRGSKDEFPKVEKYKIDPSVYGK